MSKHNIEQGITINVPRYPNADGHDGKNPRWRCGELDEVAQMIAWIVSPTCRFTSGFTFELSGRRATY